MPFRLFLILPIAGLLAACDGGGLPIRAGGEDPIEADPVPVAAYERRFLLLGGDEDAPLGMVYDFDILDLGTAVHHAAVGWLGRGAVWEAFLDERWEVAPLRDPWRLVPHGPFRLIIGDDGEPSALIYRTTDREIRLLPGEELSTWDPRGDVQLRLRQAGVLLGSERYAARLVETLTRGDPDFNRSPEGPHIQEELFLSDGHGLYLVVIHESWGSIAWISGEGIDRRWREISVNWVQRQAYEPARRSVPTAWWIESPGGTLRGEIQAAARDLIVLPDGSAQPAVRGAYTVRGWVELDGNRRPIFGLVRHAQR